MAFAKKSFFHCVFFAMSLMVRMGDGNEYFIIRRGVALKNHARHSDGQNIYATKSFGYRRKENAHHSKNDNLYDILNNKNQDLSRMRTQKDIAEADDPDDIALIRRKRDFDAYDADLMLSDNDATTLLNRRHVEVLGMMGIDDFDSSTVTQKDNKHNLIKRLRDESNKLSQINATVPKKHELFKPGRRLGNSLRELASRRHQENKSNTQRMQNDHHESSFATNQDDAKHKGEYAGPFSGQGQFDVPKISYDDKIRQLNTKLNEQHYGVNLNQMNTVNSEDVVSGISCDFEKPCNWHWNTTGITNTFDVYTPGEISKFNMTPFVNHKLKGPAFDADNNTKGHFLYYSVGSKSGIMTIRSPKYFGVMETCKVVVWLHQYNMQNASFKVVIETTNGAPWVLSEMQGNNYESWKEYAFPVGRVQQEFNIILEVVPGGLMSSPSFAEAYLALDNLKMAGCFAELATVDQCSPRQLKCLSNKMLACLNSSRVCDIMQDCDQGEDEIQDCDKMPFGSRCSFDDGWCGWMNTPIPNIELKWSFHSGSTPTQGTGPANDHTCEKYYVPGPLRGYQLSNGTSIVTSHAPCVGYYLFVNMAQRGRANNIGFASNANLDSVIFNPPPRVHGDINSKYYNSCMIRFYFHQHGKNQGSLTLNIIELKDKENSSNILWRSSGDRGPSWNRADVILPNVTTRYYLQFESRRGMRIYSDIALDDFSMAPECFGINVPKQNLGDYNYWDPIHSNLNTKPHKDFENKTYYELTTCGATGRFGPSQEQCNSTYKNTSTWAWVMNDAPFKGVQAWTVPTEGYYTIIAHGAGGGLGSGGTGSTRGASVRALLDLHKGQTIYAIVGQPGSSACIKTLSVLTESNCKFVNNTNNTDSLSTTTDTIPLYYSKTQQIKNTIIEDGGGGGGGGTFIFFLNKQKNPSPIMVAGGGGGLGAGSALKAVTQHGKGALPANRRPRTGNMYGAPNKTPGAGGGWLQAPGFVTSGHEEVRGQAAVDGAAGGRACTGGSGPGFGGFGGGGGGCTKGGAGGGWAGGDTLPDIPHGEGGYSFVDHGRTEAGFTEILSGMHSGFGQVIIIPAIEGCGCNYRCVALDEYRSKTKCICPVGWLVTGINQTKCEWPEEESFSYIYVLTFFGIVLLLLIIALGIIFVMLYNRYQVRKAAAIRHKALLEQDFQLSRLRNTADDSALTNFNPNYGCDAVLAGGVDVRQLPQVARDSLRLVKALGQGAFGEVYQGLYRHRDGDTIEMPVAVKTLPEMSTGQSETDFLMEAAIMAKFNHPNIVHLIGVCFDRHPRFIVLELLAGGDLKIFLRENRPKPERSSSLGMKDLVLCAMDVAKGCRYMETKRFIHRDIAARNCLLTSKGPGRVVKIADFGMARDIYRSDYYRKGGKARLPIKWMPPEAFMDGIFTSKTDVWSFGVLLWEVFSLGIMPYTGCANREVMQIVTGGGRLDIPHGCPNEIYRMMCDCWNPSPQDRPTFSQLFEKLTHCLQDPELMSAPLTCFTRAMPLSREMDDHSQSVQQACGMIATQASDYLVPLQPFANNVNTGNGPTVLGVTSVPIGQSSSESVPLHPENLDGMPPSHSSSSDHLLSSSLNNEDVLANTIRSAAPGMIHPEQSINVTMPKQAFKQIYSPEYGNIILSSRGITPGTNDNTSANYPHNSKFQPSKSTDRLLASMESAARDDSIGDDEDEDDQKQWETSFIERKPDKQNANENSDSISTTGPIVDKLISIDTPQQTPTSLQPPDNSLSHSLNVGKKSSEATMSPKDNDRTNNYAKTNLTASTVNFVKQKPLCLDAALLEQNLNALKKNSGSVNLNNMNILPPYVNVLTPNKLSKNSESRKIQIDPKKAIIHDLATPPGIDTPSSGDTVKEVSIQEEPKLKTSASGNSLINGPLTDLPYADSDNGSSSSSNVSGGVNAIARLAPGSKQNNYTEVSLPDGSLKKVKKQNSAGGGFLNNDSEISC